MLQCMPDLVPYQSGAWAHEDGAGVPLDGAGDSEDVRVVEALQEHTQEVLDHGAHEFKTFLYQYHLVVIAINTY